MAYFYAVCAVCVTTFSTGGEIPPSFKLHALTQVAHSYAHLLAITQLCAHPHHEFWHVHIRNIKKHFIQEGRLEEEAALRIINDGTYIRIIVKRMVGGREEIEDGGKEEKEERGGVKEEGRKE